MKTRSRCALPVLLLVLSGGAEGQKPDIVLSSDHFTTVVDVTYDAGHIFVLDRAAKSIFAFDKTTHQLLRSIGRSGKGPGEFLFPARLGWLGDTLWVHDLSNSRFTLLVGENPVGTVGLMTSIQPLGARTASPVRAEWLRSDGGMLGTLLTTLDVMALGILDSIPYSHSTESSGRADNVLPILKERGHDIAAVSSCTGGRLLSSAACARWAGGGYRHWHGDLPHRPRFISC